MKVHLVLGPPIREGVVQHETGDPYQYPVLGLPEADRATINKTDDRWRVWRKRDAVEGDMDGDFDTPERALAALESEYRDS